MDARAILLSGDKTQVLTQAPGGFAERSAALIHPLCNFEFYDADGNRLQTTYSKENVVVVLRTVAGAPVTGGMIFRGLWLSGTEAKYQEVYKVPVGSYAGTYVCVNVNGSSADPWTGVDWVMISQSNAIGQW